MIGYCFFKNRYQYWFSNLGQTHIGLSLNASNVIDVDAKGTMGGASDGSTKNGPDTEHLMKMTTPTKGESTERLHRRTRQGVLDTDISIRYRYRYYHFLTKLP